GQAYLEQAYGGRAQDDKAEYWLRQTLNAAPQFTAARLDLAELLLTEQRFGDAAQQSRAILENDAENEAASLLFAKSLLGLGQKDAARMILEALSDGAKNKVVRNQAVLVLVGMKEIDAAKRLALLESVLKPRASAQNFHKTKPVLLPFYYARAELNRELGRITEAAQDYQKCLEIDAADQFGAAAGLALLSGRSHLVKPSSEHILSDAHLEKLFDEYAPRFDQHLLGQLQYRVPDLLVAALQNCITVPIRVLDLGCGTGLLGLALRRNFPSLITGIDGVDLSAHMLHKAAQSGAYTNLHQGNIVTHLQAVQTGSYDLITAADVLVYVGDLDPLLRQIARILPMGGRAGFTVEMGDDAPQNHRDYYLQESRRYAHNMPYITQLARQYDFVVVTCDRENLRQDGGKDITGLVVVLQKN
ncbi:MAG: methyltransferase domain-containing protein, partial [Alphaproteobacteria bacterium]|nr:methyltransferase domain-containing protein [Alphaproteobacteria bacterium]